MNPKIPAYLSIVFAVLTVVFKILNAGWFLLFFIFLSPVLIIFDVFYILLNFLWVRKKVKMPILMAISSILVGFGMMMSTLLLPDFGDTPEFIWLFRVWPLDKYEGLANFGYGAAMVSALVSVVAFVVFVVCYYKFSPKNKIVKV